MMQQMTLVVCKLITTCLSVAKCQYCPRYRKITLTVANLVRVLTCYIEQLKQLSLL